MEGDVKMMDRCIRLDMECAALCYTAAQLMSLESEKAKEICLICADTCEQWNALIIKMNIARNVQDSFLYVLKNAEKWRHKDTE